MHHRSDCFSNGGSSIHFARDDGSIMEYSKEYPFRPLGLLKTEVSSGDQQLCDMRTVGETLFLIYTKKTDKQTTNVTVANDANTKISTITIITPHPASTFTVSIEDMLDMRITFINTNPGGDRVLASHHIQIDLSEPLLMYNLNLAFSPGSADFHVGLSDDFVCDVLATKDTMAILSSSSVILYSLTDKQKDPIQLFIPETDVSNVDPSYTNFGGIQHPLLQSYRLFCVGTVILVLTPNCLYQIEHFSDNTSSLSVVSKISSRILTYTATDNLFALCTSNYTVLLLFMLPGADYLSINIYNLANDVNNRLFSLSLDYLIQASKKPEEIYLEKLPSTWPAIPNPLGLTMDRHMDGLVTKRCVQRGSTNILSTFPSRPSHSNIRILFSPLHSAGKESLLVTLVHLVPPTSLTGSSSDFTVISSFIHDLSNESEQARVHKIDSLSKMEAAAFSGKKSSFFKDIYGSLSSSVKIKTGSDAVAAISEGLFIDPSYLSTKPIVYYLHLLVTLNVAICITLSRFLITNSHFNNIRMVRHAKMSILYDILTLRDDLMHYLTSEWKHIKDSPVSIDDLQTHLLLSAYGNQDVSGLYSHLYYSDASNLNLIPPSIHSGNRLLSVFSVGFTSGLSVYDLTKTLSLKVSPRNYTNAFTAIDTMSLSEYTSSFRHSVFYAEFRLVAWSLSSSYRAALGGKCSEYMPCLSDDFSFDKGMYSKLDKKLNWLPLYSSSTIPHESVYLAGGTLHHTMFLSSCHVPMETSIFTTCTDIGINDINQYVVKLLSSDVSSRNFYLPRFFYIGNTTSPNEISKQGNEAGPSQANNGAPNGQKLSTKTVSSQRLYCKFDTIITLREFTRRFLPDFDVLMSILSSLFGMLLEVVRTQSNRAKYILRMISLDTVFLEFTSLNGFGDMHYFGKDMDASPYRIKLPFYMLGPESSALFPSRNTLPPLLSDSAHISTEYYPSLLITGLVAQLFFELMQIYTSGMLTNNDIFDVEKLANVIEHAAKDMTVTYTPGSLVLKQNNQATLYNPAMCDVSTAFDVLFNATARPYQRLLYLNNILLNIHLLAKLDIELVVRTVYQNCSRIAGHQFTVINLLKLYDFFCHAAQSIVENPMELQIMLKVLRERFGTHMQYYDSIFESNLSINQSDFLDYVAFCKEKIPPFLLHLYDKSPTRDYTIVVESLLYSNEDLMYRQQIVDSYRSDPVYQAMLKKDPNHPIIRLKDAILELRLHRKYRIPCKITKDKILHGMLEACMNATPTTHTVCVTYENDPGIDGGGIFRSMISQCFMELLNEVEIHGSPILNMVDHTLIPSFLGYVPLASSEVYPRLSEKRSALYYLGRLFAFAVIYNVRFPKVFDSRLISSLIGGRLYLDEKINKEYKTVREKDPMFDVNGTPVDLVYPMDSQFYKRYYDSADKLIKFALGKIYTEGRDKGHITGPQCNMDDIARLVAALKNVPDYNVPEIFDDIATPDFIISTRRLTETKNCALKWIVSLFNGIKSGEAFKKHLSEFRNGFRQPFGNAMTQKSEERIQNICQRIDIALSEISRKDFEALFMADLKIDRAAIANIITPYTKSDPLENLGETKRNVKDRKQMIEILISFLKQVIMDPKLMSSANLGDFMYAATGSRYTIGITLYVKAHSEGPLVIFHTCNNLIELPSCIKSTEEMHKALLFSMHEAVQGGFGIA